jgi:HAD superfamily hydrolase (TIGR01490 family)
MKSDRLVLFDFDGTLTDKDTFFEFISFVHGKFQRILGLMILSPILILFKLGLVKNQFAKESVLKYFFKGTSLSKFNENCALFSKSRVPKLIRANALTSLKEHISYGAIVVVVSASPENWVREWCHLQGIDCISTRLKVIDNLITGELDGNNCYGPEKVRRVKEVFEIEHFKEIIAYGDSSGDKEMLAIASKPYYRSF